MQKLKEHEALKWFRYDEKKTQGIFKVLKVIAILRELNQNLFFGQSFYR